MAQYKALRNFSHDLLGHVAEGDLVMLNDAQAATPLERKDIKPTGGYIKPEKDASEHAAHKPKKVTVKTEEYNDK